MTTRRETLQLALVGSALLAQSATAQPATTAIPLGDDGEHRRRADLGNGNYRNPVLAGDHPDPTILRDGDDYWMTHSSFDATPGLLLWHSRDLVNWTPVANALARPLGTVFAVDLAKVNDRYFIYIPFMAAPWSQQAGKGALASFANIFVIHADHITGPWSEPIDLGIGGLIDPGHVVDEHGQRWLYLSGVNRVPLTLDGLATAGPVEPAYAGWHYPDDWVTEGYSLEGPKLVRRGEWFYLISAVGGTAGPPTGHMVIVARSRSARGPWENSPHNPLIRSQSADEPWWSRGHATLFEGPRGQWYAVYHGYENGFRSLGRQCLLEPVGWTADGWPVALGGDLSRPLPHPLPGAASAPAGLAGSDDFATLALGTRWTFGNGGPDEVARATVEAGALVLAARGTSPADSAPLVQIPGDRAYAVEVEMTLSPRASGGLVLWYNDRMFFGFGHDGTRMTTWRGGKASYWPEPAGPGLTWLLRVENRDQIVTLFYRRDGNAPWTRHGVRSEVSGVHANTMDDLAALRPALYAAGQGSVRFRRFRYRAL